MILVHIQRTQQMLTEPIKGSTTTRRKVAASCTFMLPYDVKVTIVLEPENFSGMVFLVI